MVYVWFTQNVTMREPIPDSCFVIMAIVLQWFSLNDCVDGMRARRAKCGSPLGRIIDEAIDQMAYACLGAFIGYLLRVEPGFWLLSIGLVNVPFYCMEIRHCYCKNFLMIVGELGPVEVELIYSLILMMFGVCWGGNSMDMTVAELTGLSYSFLAIKLKYTIAVLTFVLEILFAYDNVKDSFNINPKESIRLLTPVFILLGVGYLSSYLPSYYEETVIVYFMYQMTFAIIILKLMLFNMSGKPMSAWNIQYMYPLIPVVAYLVFGVSADLEIMLNRSCMLGAFIEFFYTIYRLSKQYCTEYNVSFFTIKQKL